MKREKKFAALIVAMLLCFALCVAAFAAESDI